MLKINVLWKTKSVAFALILLASLAILNRTIRFYFWGDDFSILYNAQNSICPFAWPFNSYCPEYGFLYKIFSYSPTYYFVTALLLRFILGCLFYLFLLKIFNSARSLILSVLLVTAGAEDNLLTFYAISENAALVLLFVAILCFFSIQKNKILYLILGGVASLISLKLFPIYSTTHVFLIFSVMLFYLRNKVSTRLFGAASAFLLSILLATYIIVPFLQTGNLFRILDQSRGGNQITVPYLSRKVLNYLSTSSSFILTDYIESMIPSEFRLTKLENLRIYLGLLLNLILVFYLFLMRKKGAIFRKTLLALSWFLILYIPKGLVTNNGMINTDRHFFYPYIGFLLVLGSLSLVTLKDKVVVLLGLGLILLSAFQTNNFFKLYEEINHNRTRFYDQLRGYLSREKITGGTFYFNAPPGEIDRKMGDFFRAGMLPSESSLATLLGLRMNEITLLIQNKDLSRVMKEGKISSRVFYSFYYDGVNLIDTTNESRSLLDHPADSLFQSINMRRQVDAFPNDIQVWPDRKGEPSFTINNFKPLLPAQVLVNLSATIPNFPLIYSRKCINCDYNPAEMRHYLDFLRLSRLLKNKVDIITSQSGDDTSGVDLKDSSLESYWVPPRDAWFRGERPVIKLVFNEKVKISGLVIYAGSKYHIPREFRLLADGQPLDFLSVYGEGRIKITFKDTEVRDLDLTILATDGDRPSIEEIGVIPAGFADIDLATADKYFVIPGAMIRTEQDKQSLSEYLRAGSYACLEWDSPSFGKGKIGFFITPDGLPRTYKMRLPAMGLGGVSFRIGCLFYPVDLNLISATISPLRHDE